MQRICLPRHGHKERERRTRPSPCFRLPNSREGWEVASRVEISSRKDYRSAGEVATHRHGVPSTSKPESRASEHDLVDIAGS